MSPEEYISYTHLIFFITGFTGSLVLFFKRRLARNHYLPWVLLMVSTGSGYNYLYYSGVLLKFPYLYGLNTVAFAAVFPFMFLYLCQALEYDFVPRFFHFIPMVWTVAQFANLVPYYVMDREKLMDIVSESIKTLNPETLIGDPFPFLLTSNYLFLAFFDLAYMGYRMSWHGIGGEFRQKGTARNVLGFLVVWGVTHAFVITLNMLFVKNPVLYSIIDIISVISALSLFVFITIIPELVNRGLFSKPGDHWNGHMFLRSRLLRKDRSELKKHMLEIFEKKKVYLNDGLKRTDVGKLLELDESQVSELVNTEFRISFNDFVNGYRIEHAKELMAKGEMNQVHICYACGFSAYSSYFRAFKEVVGLSPEDWRMEYTHKVADQSLMRKRASFKW